MQTKFKAGEEVIHNGEKKTVVVSSKDFSTQKISYVLSDTSKKIPESELSKISKSEVKESEGKEDLHAQYLELYGKNVPNKYKKNVDWIREKIEEKVSDPVNIDEMDLDMMIEYIQKNELDIDMDKIESEQDLRNVLKSL